MLDTCLTNGNAYNDTGINIGETGLGYGDDAECPREDCNLDRVLSRHRVAETIEVANLAALLVKEVEKLSNKQRGPYGRMVGVGQCECGQIWKAVSGRPLADQVTRRVSTGVGKFCNEVNIAPGDGFMQNVVAANNQWKCAALKIISNAAGHKLIALSEKWVGNPRKDGIGRYPKFIGAITRFSFPYQTFQGMLISSPDWRPDRVAGAPPGNEIPSGDSVPSCGTCQAFLPALVCKMTPCG